MDERSSMSLHRRCLHLKRAFLIAAGHVYVQAGIRLKGAMPIRVVAFPSFFILASEPQSCQRFCHNSKRLNCRLRGAALADRVSPPLSIVRPCQPEHFGWHCYLALTAHGLLPCLLSASPPSRRLGSVRSSRRCLRLRRSGLSPSWSGSEPRLGIAGVGGKNVGAATCFECNQGPATNDAHWPEHRNGQAVRRHQGMPGWVARRFQETSLIPRNALPFNTSFFARPSDDIGQRRCHPNDGIPADRQYAYPRSQAKKSKSSSASVSW